MPEQGGPAAIARRVLVAYVVLVAVMAAIGWVVTGVVDGSVVGELSRGVPQDLVGVRSGALDVVAAASSLTDEWTVVALVAGAAGMLAAGGYGRHASLLVLALVLEVAVHVTVTVLVGRPRPDVVLAPAAREPFTSSFPSGHVGVAVVVYGCLAVITAALVRDDGARKIMVGVAVVATALVAFARMYLGVHDVVDVVAGAAMGVAVLAVARRAVGPLPARDVEGKIPTTDEERTRVRR